MGDAGSAVAYFEDTVEFLSKLPKDDFDVIKHNSNVPSQVLDVAISLAKVADMDRNLGDTNLATSGFQEAIGLLESLTLKSEASGLEQWRLSVLDLEANLQINKNKMSNCLSEMLHEKEGINSDAISHGPGFVKIS